MIRAAVARPKAGQIGLTQRLDRWAVHPLAGLVILAGMLGLVFWLTFALGAPLQAWLDTQVVVRLSAWSASWLASAPSWRFFSPPWLSWKTWATWRTRRT
jgi:ferrous iron transport protein B